MQILCLTAISEGNIVIDYNLLLLGILVMQDVFLGFLMALLPNMAASSNRRDDNTNTAALYGLIGAQLIAGSFVERTSV